MTSSTARSLLSNGALFLCFLLIVLLFSYIFLGFYDATFARFAQLPMSSFADVLTASVVLVSFILVAFLFLLLLYTAPSVMKTLFERRDRGAPF